jgi:large subunit ribosomal protein L21e
MVRSSRGFRTGTRRKLKKGVRSRSRLKGKMQDFKPRDRVIIVQNPTFHKGMPHPRFKGATGTVIEKRGSSYVIEIKDKNKHKIILSAPEHLKK